MNHQENSNQVELAVSAIASELHVLREGAARLRDIYAEAAVTSDLTFIKILEEKYEQLTHEISLLVHRVSGVQSSFYDGGKETV